MKKIILITAIAALTSCGVNYRLSKACNVSVVAASATGGKITACVTCDSITPRLLKKLQTRFPQTTYDTTNVRK